MDKKTSSKGWKEMTEQVKIDLMAVESSQIAKIGYDLSSKTLVVKFKKGAVYSYSEVPQKIFDEFMQAESKGKYFHAKVKGIFKYLKLS